MSGLWRNCGAVKYSKQKKILISYSISFKISIVGAALQVHLKAPEMVQNVVFDPFN
jgi:hypothetical protein